MSRAEVTIGIPACDDDPRVLSLALDAIAAEPVAHPPVIVDMSSTDRIAELVRARPERIRYVRRRESTGVEAISPSEDSDAVVRAE